MCCSGSVKAGETGAGGDYSYSMQTCASIDDGGRRHPTAVTGPHSWLLSIQQSTNIICDRTTLLKLEKFIIIMLFSYSQARRVVMFASRDDRTANAEHQQ